MIRPVPRALLLVVLLASSGLVHAVSDTDVNARRPDGSTELQWAAYESRVEDVRRLIKAGADVDARNDFGASAVSIAAALKLRLPGRSMPGDRNGDFRVLTTGATPLMRAAVGCDVPAMKLLLEHGAKVDLPIADGTTPFSGVLISASTRARFKTEEQALAALTVLKEAGAEVRHTVSEGPRVLHIIHLHTIDHARVAGTTPLMMAVVRDWKRVVRQLAEWGVDLDAKDADGMTALDYAMGRERYGFLQVKPSPVPDMAPLLKQLGATQESAAAPPWPPLSVPQITARVPELLY